MPSDKTNPNKSAKSVKKTDKSKKSTGLGLSSVRKQGWCNTPYSWKNKEVKREAAKEWKRLAAKWKTEEMEAKRKRAEEKKAKREKTTAKKTGTKTSDSSRTATSGRSRQQKKAETRPVTEEEKLLSTMQFTPDKVLTFEYSGLLKTEHKTELGIVNPTNVVVAYKVKTTKPDLIKVSPAMGYVKPDGKITVWVMVQPTPNGKPLVNERLTILLSQLTGDKIPPNPKYFWNSADKPQKPFRRILKLAFKEETDPPPKSISTANFVVTVNNVDGEEESESEGEFEWPSSAEENSESKP